MDKGLDELIESLLTEIAFSGSRGCSVLDLVGTINSFYGTKPAASGKQTGEPLDESTNEASTGDNDRGRTNIRAHDLGLASKVWGWLVARNDVSVGINRKFNSLGLEEVLAICEQEKTSEAPPTQKAPSNNGSSRRSKKLQNSEDIPQVVGPRLYVSEVRQWKTLTGHGPDFKRIPLFEWKALVDIASVREKGILQGDLVRLTGQDKRSLPTRTDALAKKGYIIKQPILLRGFRSSKLWLKQYAESAEEEAKREGLPLEELDLSKESLMQDLNPVSFNNYWNGDKLDYLAIAQGFIAITKAWGIIRYCDLRTKMGVDERVPQMRALAKSSRWFTKLGAVTFVAARFANSSKLFKDCVKFIRDPTPNEWREFRSIPTNHIKAPSSRVGKRGQASRDNAKLKARKAEIVEPSAQAKLSASKAPEELLDQMEVTSSSWIPQKPFVNTAFDIIKRAGPEGSSNNEIRHLTLGYNYRKFIASMNASLSSPLVQPEQLEFRVISRLIRIRKTMLYQFFAPGSTAPTEDSGETIQGQDQPQEVETAQRAVERGHHSFSEPDPSKFITNPSASLTQLCKPAGLTSKSVANRRLGGVRKEHKIAAERGEVKRPRGRPRKQPQTTESLDPHDAEPQDGNQSADLANQTPNDGEGRGPGRLRRKPRKLEGMVIIPDDAHLEDLTVESPIREEIDDTTPAKRRRPSLPDIPGVYRGTPNSLDPDKRKGRPRKSLVLIFKSDKLRDPTFFGATTGTSPENGIVVATGQPDDTVLVDSTSPTVADGEPVVSVESGRTPLARGSATSKKGPRSDPNKGYTCGKCGRHWKNPNGLEYHTNKSQTPCNPLYVENSPWQKSLPVPHATTKFVYDNEAKSTSLPSQPSSPSLSGRPAENKVVTEIHAAGRTLRDESNVVSIPDTPSKLGEAGRSIVLRDVEVYNVTSQSRVHRRSASRRGKSSSAQTPQLSPGDHEIPRAVLDEAPGQPEQPQDLQTTLQEDTITLSTDNAEPRQSEVHRDGSQGYAEPSSWDVGNKVPQKRGTAPKASSYEDVEAEVPRKRQKHSRCTSSQPKNDDNPQQSEQPDKSEQQSITPDHNDAVSLTPELAESRRAEIKSPPTRAILQDFLLRPTSAEPTSGTAATPTVDIDLEQHRSSPTNDVSGDNVAEGVVLPVLTMSNNDQTTSSTYDNNKHGELLNADEEHISNQVSASTYPKPVSRSSATKQTSASEGAIRRERTSAIIHYLLDNNDGVFPGELSLYVVVSCIWSRKHSDLNPPDRKIVQSLVNRMEKRGELKQLHFFFLDQRGDSKGICVIANATSGENRAEELSRDPRVVSVKDKIREVHPEVYIPPSFPLSQQELESHSALLSKHKEPSKRGRRLDSSAKPSPAQAVEVMHYPQPIMTNIGGAEYSLPSIVADEDFNINPSKVSRKGTPSSIPPENVSLDESLKSRVVLKPRKRVPARDYWDASKMATYIWKKNHCPVATWDQTHACLQDTTTGAWSSVPQIVVSSGTNFDEFLAFLTGGKTKSRRAGRKRKNSEAAVPPRKRISIRHTSTWKGDDYETVEYNGESTAEISAGPAEDPFMEPSTAASFTRSYFGHDANDSDGVEDDTVMVSSREVSILEDDSNEDDTFKFGQIKEIKPFGEGYWPSLPGDFFDSKKTSFSMNGSMPSAGWFRQVNLPSSVDDILNISRRRQIRMRAWTDKQYAEFVLRANAIRNWELSAGGSHILLTAPILPGSIFLDLEVDDLKVSTQPIVLDWSRETQYTIDNLPGRIKYGIHDDQDAGLSDIGDSQDRSTNPTKSTKSSKLLKSPKSAKKRTREPKQKKAREFKHHFTIDPQSGQVQVGYKTRDLIALPPSQQGRVSKRQPSNDMIGLLGDTALITAFVVIKSLLGGAEGTIDYGLILKIFPEKSFTRLKNFWPKACKQRKRFVDALTEKFQSSFLEAYEKGELPPIDFDNPEDYDWVSLIVWATKLETHSDVDLPRSRDELNQSYMLEDPDDEIIDWREVWFDNVAVHTRIEANIAKPAIVPVCKPRDESALIIRARSWIRSLCNTSMGEAGAPNRVMRKLLELGDGNEKETNRIFVKVVAQLIKEKIATRGKSKKFGFRLNYNFDRVADKGANTEKYRQAVAFKSRLDEAFREHGEMFLRYASDNGSILAAVNLQAYGRIRMEPVDLPDIPFGFEPGNYEGRSFPKSYYHWKIRLAPTDRYLYDGDMPLLERARRTAAPTGGPGGTIPIWVDLLGRVDGRRWAEYVCMLAFALATKGPLTAASACAILKPVLEPFEAELIMGFLDGLGLLQRVTPDAAAAGTAGEWWWLAVGHMIDAEGRGVGDGNGNGNGNGTTVAES